MRRHAAWMAVFGLVVFTQFQCAPRHSAKGLLGAAQRGDLDTAKELVDRDANISVADRQGKMPLHLAAEEGHKSVAELLMAKGADINARDKSGKTPLHLAARGGHMEIVRLLVEKGAEVNPMSNRRHHTPLDEAKEKHPEVADFLRAHGGKTGEEIR